jgi:hypothetical protein
MNILMLLHKHAVYFCLLAMKMYNLEACSHGNEAALFHCISYYKINVDKIIQFYLQ